MRSLKGRKEENVVCAADADTLSMPHLNLCVSESWRCHVTTESTNSLRASVLWEQAVNPSVRGKALPSTCTRGTLHLSCSVFPLPLLRKDFASQPFGRGNAQPRVLRSLTELFSVQPAQPPPRT